MIDFIQLGANVGDQPEDILWRLIPLKNWKGIFVEPVPSSFEKLKENYAHLEGCFFENVAVMDYEGEVTLYLNDKFDNETATAFGPKAMRAGRRPIEVPCVTLDSLIDKYNLRGVKFHILQIDIESAEDKVLLSTSFRDILPRYIRFEDVHLSQPVQKKIAQHLARYGYNPCVDLYKDFNPAERGRYDVMYERESGVVLVAEGI